MFSIFGFLVVPAMVFGSFYLAGGHFQILIEAMPLELMTIGGASIGIFLIANDKHIVLGALKDIGRVFKGARWVQSDYRDVLTLMFTLIKLIRTKGLLILESHLEKPEDSAIFQRYPKILGDHFALDFITDTLRMMVMSIEDPFEVSECMQRQIEKHEAELETRGAALQNLADSLPALGIVAAVLGVVKTMASINQPVEILGAMIGGALVGTFLGILLSYGFVGPMAAKMRATYHEDGHFYAVIKDCLIGSLQGHPAPVACELARGNVPTTSQPSFKEMEEMFEALPADPLAPSAI
ncbi:chemotaxis protein MotA [Arboricoccus pini]|uniref:Chemotaxis protein MotA n=1 Tax=Arboricoccus pini TaxID=1963835 RepID=A0A212QPM4_9PROT|nr:flagellar motor stator protein MotA [Arboricoccus pini]SNB61348.1 chemotaxis protein MotA [Arboricoccus pini]